MNSHSNTGGKRVLKVCTGPACTKNFSQYIVERAEKKIAKKSDPNFEFQTCGCQGNCEKGPTVVTEKNSQKTLHKYMDPIKTAHLIDEL